MRRLHIVTYVLIAINVGLGVLAAKTNFSVQTLLSWGAMSGHMPQVELLNQFPPFVNHIGQYQTGIFIRAISGTPLLILRATYASFLHFSWMHLASNMLVLYMIGRQFEDSNYFGLLLPVYWITGVVSMVSAYVFQPNAITVGASGAIFGIMGTCFVLSWRARHAYNIGRIQAYSADMYIRTGNYAYFLIVFNLISTFLTPNISVVGHISGLITGAVLGLIIPLSGKE